MKKYSKLMAVLLVVAMLLPGMAQAATGTQDQAKVMRVAGDSRVGTSIKVSEVAMDSATDAVLVGYNGEADALTGAIVAKAKNAPLFYVRTSEIEAVKARLDDLGVANVHILGGTTVFTKELMKEFDAYNPVRIDGDNRYETAINAAKVAVGDKADTVFLAKGNETLADALSIGAISAKENTPLLLTHGTNLTEVTKQALKDMEVKNIEIIGGKSAVSEEIKEELEGLGYTVNRTAGDNRQATSVEIAKKFNPEAKEIVIANGFDYADAVTAGYFAAGRDAVVLLTNQNLVHPSVKEFLEDNKLDTTVLGGTSAIAKGTFDKVVEYLDGVVVEMPEEEEEIELAVESVSAINAKALKVTFNRAVEDTSEAVFGVKRGTTTVSGLEATWNEAKTEATLTSGVNLPAGDYVVTVTGLTDEALVSDAVTVVAQKVTEIEFLSNDLVKSAVNNQQATFTYKVFDQYNTDITKTIANSAVSKSVVVGSTTGTITLDPTKGIATVDKGAAFVDTDKKAVVTLVHAASGTTATATMDIVASATVESLTFGENILPTGKTNIETGLSEAVKVPVTVMDQYGNKINDLATLNGAITLVSSNTNVIPTFTLDADDNTFVVLDTSSLTTKETVVLTAINPSTGKSFAKTFEIVKPSVPYAIELGELSSQTIADGDTGITLPITVTDQFGKELTADEIVSNKGTIEGWVTGDATYVTNFTIVNDKNNEDYGKFTFNATAKGTASIVINTGNAISTKLIEVKDARIVTTVGKANAVTLLQGATTDLEFVIRDQYNEVIKNADLTTTHQNDDLTYKIEVKKLSGDNSGIVVNSPALTHADEDKLKEINITAATNKTGSYNVVVTLLEGAVEVSSASTKVTVAENNVAGLVYSVSDVPMLNGSTGIGALDASNEYAQEMKLTAKDANGQEYVINSGDIVSVTSSDSAIANAAKASDNKIYVAGDDVTGTSTPAKEEKATITIKLNTLDGIKTLTKEVTVSPVAPEVKEVKVVSAALGGATTDITGVTEKSVFTFADKAAAITGSNIFTIGKDQYGVWDDITAPTVIVNSTNFAPFDSFEIGTGKLKVAAAKANDVMTGKDIKITLTEELGSVEITAKITAADEITLTQTAVTADEKFQISNNFGEGFTAQNTPQPLISASPADLNEYEVTLTAATGTTPAGADEVSVAMDGSGEITVTVNDASSNGSLDGVHTLNVKNVATGLTETITLTISSNGSSVVVTE